MAGVDINLQPEEGTSVTGDLLQPAGWEMQADTDDGRLSLKMSNFQIKI